MKQIWKTNSEDNLAGEGGRLEMNGMLVLVATYLRYQPNNPNEQDRDECGNVAFAVECLAQRQSELIERLLYRKEEA